MVKFFPIYIPKENLGKILNTDRNSITNMENNGTLNYIMTDRGQRLYSRDDIRILQSNRRNGY